MLAGDILALFRERADDEVAEYLYSDVSAYRWMSEGEREAALRANLLWDDSNFVIDVVANTATYDLDPLVLHIDAARLTPSGARAIDLEQRGLDWVRSQCDWDTRTATRPWVIAHVPPAQVRLYPTPSLAGSLALSVYRLPFYDMEGQDDEPEIPAAHHDGLVDWMLYRAFTTKDGEQQDPQRAAEAYDRFEQRFGQRPDATTLQRQQARRRITTRMI